MPRGLRFDQIGVTEAMIETWADIVWEMSNNVQVRRGDPIRLREFARLEADRASLGMSDGQIAAAIGLTRTQVMVIRSLTEARRFRRRNYFELYGLGRGKRFNPERHVPLGRRSAFNPDALALRDALRFDPAQVRRAVASGAWGADTLPGWLAARAAASPASPALRDAAGDLSYSALQAQVRRLAAGLHALGLGRGDVIAVQLPNAREFVLAYLAVARIGAVLSTAHMPYRDADLRTLLVHGRARALVCLAQTRDYAPAAAALAMRKDLPALDHIIAVGDAPAGTVSYAALLASAASLPDDLAPAPADPLLLLYTSGTSASPKAVPQTHQTVLGNARVSAPEHAIGPGDVVLSAAPLSHLFGLYGFHLALSAGAACQLLPAFAPPDFAQAIARGRPTVLLAGPAHFAAMLKTGLLDSADFASVRLVICSGSACPPELARAVAARLPNGCFSQLWGMTETQAGLYTRPGDPIDVAAVSAGRPSPGTEVRIASPDGVSLPAGEEGELQVRGGLLFPGYYDNAEANASAFASDGWFRSGDLAVQDAAGNVRITGRIKDVINRGGVKYNPRDVEDLLDAHPAVMQAAIVPMPDAVLGERACCFVVPKGDAPPTLESLCAWLAERGIAKHQMPERLELVAEMPLTPTRKVIKGRLAAMLAGR